MIIWRGFQIGAKPRKGHSVPFLQPNVVKENQNWIKTTTSGEDFPLKYIDSEAFDEGFQDKCVINVIKKILSLYLLAFIEVGGARHSADGQ